MDIVSLERCQAQLEDIIQNHPTPHEYMSWCAEWGQQLIDSLKECQEEIIEWKIVGVNVLEEQNQTLELAKQALEKAKKINASMGVD